MRQGNATVLMLNNIVVQLILTLSPCYDIVVREGKCYTFPPYLSIAIAAMVRTEATIDKCDMKFVRRQKLVPNCQSLIN